MPTLRHGYAAVPLDGKVYVLGGGTVAGANGSTVNEVFTP
jgi:hypothetical protein